MINPINYPFLNKYRLHLGFERVLRHRNIIRHVMNFINALQNQALFYCYINLLIGLLRRMSNN